MGEIDLVAKRGKNLVMVEVKQRGDMRSALEAVTSRNQYRVSQASKHFLSRHPGYAAMNLRFDVIVMGWPFYWRHLDNAWQAHT